MSYLLIFIGAYLVYRFIVGFLLPVVRTTRQVKQQFNAMRQNMGDQQAGNTPGFGDTRAMPSEKPRYDIEGEYIQFEETDK